MRFGLGILGLRVRARARARLAQYMRYTKAI